MRKKLLNDPSILLFLPATGLREALRPRTWGMYLNPKRNRNAKKQPKLTAANALATPVKKSKPDYRLKHKARLPGFDDWEVLHTPGHTWDSCCYYHAKSGSLLSGDTLLGSGSKGRAVAPSIYTNPRKMRITLRKLKHLNINMVYPGHGSIIDLGS